MSGARDLELINAFRHVLREERQKAGLSQEALALRADVARTFVGLIEGGKRQPSLSVIFALCRGLELQPNAFIKRVERAAAARMSPGS